MHDDQSGATARFAEVRVGAARVGIPAAAVLQALAAPAHDTPLPRRQGALSGVVDHGGRLVPVLDLARWVDVGATADADTAGAGHVLVLRAGTRLLGVRVDAVGAVLDAAPGAVARLCHDDDAEEIFHSAVRGADGAILAVLDVDRLAALAATWSDAAGIDTAASAPAAPPDQHARTVYALLDAGAGRLGVAAADLAEVLPMPPRMPLAGGAWCLWRGRHVPVLALADVLAGAADGPAAPLLAVIEHGGLALGIPVRAALGLDAFAQAHADAAIAAEAIAAPAFDADGAVHLLDTARLFARFPEAALSARDGASASAHGAGPAGNDAAYLVFEADGMGAAPIADVEQVLGLSAAACAAAAGHGALEWNGRAIPLADLRGADAGGAGGHVLVVGGATPLACLVRRAHLLVPPGGGRLYRMGAGARQVEFIAVDDGAARASYRTVDLAAAARAKRAA